MFALDWKVFQLLNGLAGRSHLLDTIVRLLVNEYVITTGLALVLMFLWFGAPNATVRAHNQRTVLYAAMTMVIANLLVKSMNLAIYRYRPFAENNVHLLFYRPSDSSFPSNAATVGFSLASAVWLLNRRAGLLMYTLALLFGLSRIVAGVHYPSDILGGIVAGMASAHIIVRRCRFLDRLWSPVIDNLRRILLA